MYIILYCHTGARCSGQKTKRLVEPLPPPLQGKKTGWHMAVYYAVTKFRSFHGVKRLN